MTKKDFFLLFIIFLIAFSFRTFGINWDSGFHMHPDERAITLYLLPLHFPANFQEFFSTQSPLNPHFFAYGSLSLYLLKATSVFVGLFNKFFLSYEHIYLLGRFLSALFDSTTALVIFFIGKKLFGKHTGFLAAAVYAISVLPIQLSHFFAVDTFLTFFMTVCVYFVIRHYQNPSLKHAFFIGLFLGLGLATKNSALALVVAIGLSLLVEFLLIFFRQPHNIHVWFPHIPKVVKMLLTEGLVIVITTIITFFICEPYAFLDFQNFVVQTQEQYRMTRDPFTFPYTYQFAGKIPYVYELKNIFLWGLGPIIGLFAFIGAGIVSYIAFKKEKYTKWAEELILVTFFWSYLFIVGKFAIGFMRYMLPVYPLLALFTAVIIYRMSLYLYPKLKPYSLQKIFYLLLATACLTWTFSFISIYTKPNTRLLASQWIMQSIAPGSTIAVEHWDDTLPLFGQENYHMITLSLYNTDTAEKWQTIFKQLHQTDYIILASNRLSTPLQRLTDCEKFQTHCYPQTAYYYKQLFSGNLGFKKIAEFQQYPTLPLFHIPVIDESADESFSVFDHPKIIIFEKKRI